jgi:HAD superfamily hydrolase (TIGR01458 family)
MNSDFRGFLIDLDGVLYVGDTPVDGAQDAIHVLEENGIKFRFLSNTTRKSRRTIANRLKAMGFSIPEEYIFTPALAAAAWLKNHQITSCYFLTTGDVDQDFDSVQGTRQPGRIEVVIIGDAGDRITYDSMNEAFRHLMLGAELIALEKDRYWMAPDGISLSAGPFVSALEFATGKTATLMGKPSQPFFDMALQDMGLEPGDVAMIGDDIYTDIAGAQISGIGGILVRTGKYREEAVRQAAIKPMNTIDSIADIYKLLSNRISP